MRNICPLVDSEWPLPICSFLSGFLQAHSKRGGQVGAGTSEQSVIFRELATPVCASLGRESAAGTMTGEATQPLGHPFGFSRAKGFHPKATVMPTALVI